MYGAVQCYYCRLVLYFEIGGRSTVRHAVRTVLYSTTIADWYVLDHYYFNSTIKIVVIGIR